MSFLFLCNKTSQVKLYSSTRGTGFWYNICVSAYFLHVWVLLFIVYWQCHSCNCATTHHKWSCILHQSWANTLENFVRCVFGYNWNPRVNLKENILQPFLVLHIFLTTPVRDITWMSDRFVHICAHLFIFDFSTGHLTRWLLWT